MTPDTTTIPVYTDATSGNITRNVAIESLPADLQAKIEMYGCYGAYETAYGIDVIVEGGDEPIRVDGI